MTIRWTADRGNCAAFLGSHRSHWLAHNTLVAFELTVEIRSTPESLIESWRNEFTGEWVNTDQEFGHGGSGVRPRLFSPEERDHEGGRPPFSLPVAIQHVQLGGEKERIPALASWLVAPGSPSYRGGPLTNDLHLIGSSIPQLRYAVSPFHRKMTRHR